MLIIEGDAEVGKEGRREACGDFHGWRNFVLKVHIAVLKCAFTQGRANVACVTDATPITPCPARFKWSAVTLLCSLSLSPPTLLPLAPPPRRPNRVLIARSRLAAESAPPSDIARCSNISRWATSCRSW